MDYPSLSSLSLCNHLQVNVPKTRRDALERFYETITSSRRVVPDFHDQVYPRTGKEVNAESSWKDAQ